MSDSTNPKPTNPEGISAILAGEKYTEQDSKADAKDLTIGERFGTVTGRVLFDKPNFTEIERKGMPGKTLLNIDLHEVEVRVIAATLRESGNFEMPIEPEYERLFKKEKEWMFQGDDSHLRKEYLNKMICPICGTPCSKEGK